MLKVRDLLHVKKIIKTGGKAAQLRPNKNGFKCAFKARLIFLKRLSDNAVKNDILV